jgi:predicted amidohydrolase YtcJ
MAHPGSMTDARRFTGGRVFTGHQLAEALLIENGRVASVGTESEVARAAPTGCEVEELHGRLVIPGLVDAHLHIAETTRAERGMAVAGLRSREELVERLRRWTRDHPTGPIVGRGWNVEAFPDKREPTRHDLEAAVSDRPVILYHASGHAAVVNGAALEAAGYSDHSPDPPGGRLGREPDGAPNGLLYERAVDPVARFTSGAFPSDREEVAQTLRSIASLGVTTVGTMSTDPEELEVLTSLGRSGELPVRVRAYVRFSRLALVNIARPLAVETNDLLVVRGTKAYTDGAFGPRTAWLSEPYADLPGSSGDSTLSTKALADMVQVTVDAHLVPALHAIGDRALQVAVQALEPVERLLGAARIEHASLVPPALYPLLDQVRPTLVVQPGFVWTDAWLGERLGTQRARHAYPFRTLIERGHVLVGSSDSPYDQLDPWRGLAALVHRTDPDGRSANPSPEENLSPEQAIQLYTANAGPGLGEADLGSLEVGARADLVVVDAPDLSVAIARGAPGVQATWMAGRRTYHRAARGRP